MNLQEIEDLKSKYGVNLSQESSDLSYKLDPILTDPKMSKLLSNASTLLEHKKRNPTISWRIDSLDKLFTIPQYGTTGLRSGETYEFYGPAAAGKSQLCHQLAVNVQLSSKLGGQDKKAIYIDTEGTFSPSRIQQMGKHLLKKTSWTKNPRKILDDILVARVNTSNQLQQLLLRIAELLEDNSDMFGILIIDSIAAHFRAEFPGRAALHIRQHHLSKVLQQLSYIAQKFGLVVVATNQVIHNPNTLGDPVTAVGGNIMAHWAGTRCYLRKSRGPKRILRIVDSPAISEIEGVFQIIEEGIQ